MPRVPHFLIARRRMVTLESISLVVVSACLLESGIGASELLCKPVEKRFKTQRLRISSQTRSIERVVESIDLDVR